MAQAAVPCVCASSADVLAFHVSLAELVCRFLWRALGQDGSVACTVCTAEAIDIEGPKGDGGLARSALDCSALSGVWVVGSAAAGI
jgi:hypothetical protein